MGVPIMQSGEAGQDNFHVLHLLVHQFDFGAVGVESQHYFVALVEHA